MYIQLLDKDYIPNNQVDPPIQVYLGLKCDSTSQIPGFYIELNPTGRLISEECQSLDACANFISETFKQSRNSGFDVNAMLEWFGQECAIIIKMDGSVD